MYKMVKQGLSAIDYFKFKKDPVFGDAGGYLTAFGVKENADRFIAAFVEPEHKSEFDKNWGELEAQLHALPKDRPCKDWTDQSFASIPWQSFRKELIGCFQNIRFWTLMNDTFGEILDNTVTEISMLSEDFKKAKADTSAYNNLKADLQKLVRASEEARADGIFFAGCLPSRNTEGFHQEFETLINVWRHAVDLPRKNSHFKLPAEYGVAHTKSGKTIGTIESEKYALKDYGFDYKGYETLREEVGAEYRIPNANEALKKAENNAKSLLNEHSNTSAAHERKK